MIWRLAWKLLPATWENLLPSFGEKLKREREKRSITLEQISASTKIGTRMLQALEEDKFNQLPGGIFNKGFVRAYARFIGLDEDQTVTEYLEASGEASPPRIEPATETPVHSVEPRQKAASRDLPWGVFAAGLLIVALALSIWSYRKREHRTSRESVPSQVSIQPAVPTSPTTSNSPSEQSKSSPPARTGAVAPPPTTATSIAPAAGVFTILIHAREDSWLSITADGKLLFSDILTADSDRTVHGNNEVIVKAGNTGAVDFSFNGRKLPAQGDYGEVKTVTFGTSGLEPNRPVAPVAQ